MFLPLLKQYHINPPYIGWPLKPCQGTWKNGKNLSNLEHPWTFYFVSDIEMSKTFKKSDKMLQYLNVPSVWILDQMVWYLDHWIPNLWQPNLFLLCHCVGPAEQAHAFCSQRWRVDHPTPGHRRGRWGRQLPLDRERKWGKFPDRKSVIFNWRSFRFRSRICRVQFWGSTKICQCRDHQMRTLVIFSKFKFGLGLMCL